MPETNQPPSNQQDRHSHIKIWQQNVNGSQKAHEDLLHDVSPDNYHILAIQEPYTNNFGITRGNRGWFAIYPTPHLQNPNATRSVLLISTKIPSDRFRQIQVNHKDITAVEIHTEEGPIRIYNIHNDCTNSTSLEVLHQHLLNCKQTSFQTSA